MALSFGPALILPGNVNPLLTASGGIASVRG
jgi:hypothetical protein